MPGTTRCAAARPLSGHLAAPALGDRRGEVPPSPPPGLPGRRRGAPSPGDDRVAHNAGRADHTMRGGGLRKPCGPVGLENQQLPIPPGRRFEHRPTGYDADDVAVPRCDPDPERTWGLRPRSARAGASGPSLRSAGVRTTYQARCTAGEKSGRLKVHRSFSLRPLVSRTATGLRSRSGASPHPRRRPTARCAAPRVAGRRSVIRWSVRLRRPTFARVSCARRAPAAQAPGAPAQGRRPPEVEGRV